MLSPQQTVSMLTAKYGIEAMSAYSARNQAIKAVTAQNDTNACQGQETIRYQFGEAVMDENSVTITTDAIKLSEFEHAIMLNSVNPYAEYN